MGLSKEEKELRERYLEVMSGEKKEERGGMYKCYSDDTYKVVVLSNGRVLPIKRFKIQTDICFGYDGWDDEEEMRAHENVRKMYGDGEAFIEYNLASEYKRCIERLNINRYNLYTLVEEGKQLKKGMPICWIEAVGKCAEPKTRYQAQLISMEDYKKIKRAYEESKEEYIKRMRTYLKRYGTSKLNVWSYLRD